MKLYEIINPSDPLTMYAPDLVTAGVAIWLIGRGQYGAECVENPDEKTPIIFGWEDWFKKHGVDLEEWLTNEENRKAIITALRSIMISSPADRADYDDALKAITDDRQRREFIEKRNHRRRSSTNNIEAHAHSRLFRVTNCLESEANMDRQAISDKVRMEKKGN